MKRIQSHKGVVGTIVVNTEGISIKVDLFIVELPAVTVNSKSLNQ